MSLIPLLREIDNTFGGVEDFLEEPFGLGIYPVDIFRPRHNSLILYPRNSYCPYLARCGRPRKEASAKKSELLPTVGKDGFQVCMDVSQFKPSELTVKTVDRMVVVEGKHEEREDEHGFIQRHFIRKYSLPRGYEPKDVVSTISSDGVLTVKAPPPPAIKDKECNERIIQIQQTGPAHLNVKKPDNDNKDESNGSKEKAESK